MCYNHSSELGLLDLRLAKIEISENENSKKIAALHMLDRQG